MVLDFSFQSGEIDPRLETCVRSHKSLVLQFYKLYLCNNLLSYTKIRKNGI